MKYKGFVIFDSKKISLSIMLDTQTYLDTIKKFPLKIRVLHLRKNKKYVTGFSCTRNEWKDFINNNDYPDEVIQIFCKIKETVQVLVNENNFSLDNLSEYLFKNNIVEHKQINKTNRINLYLTDKQYEIIKLKSKGYESISHYIRNCALEGRKFNHEERRSLLLTFSEMGKHVGKIGSNINQFAKYVNERKEEVTPIVVQEFKKTLTEYMILQRQMTSVMKRLLNL